MSKTPFEPWRIDYFTDNHSLKRKRLIDTEGQHVPTDDGLLTAVFAPMLDGRWEGGPGNPKQAFLTTFQIHWRAGL